MDDEVLAADPALGFSAVSERRRHARVLAGWRQAKGDARFPAWSDAAIDPRCDGDAALFFLGDAGVETVGCDDALAAQRWGATFLERMADRVAAVQAQRSPLACEAEILVDGRETLLRGLMLPYADQAGELRFVQMVVSWREVAAASADMQSAARCAAELATAAEPVRWMARIGDAAFGERFAVARTWAALAKADPILRPRSLNAALSALLDAGLAGADRATLAVAFDDIFADSFSAREQRQFKRVLTHAGRLGLGSGGLAALLGTYPGGIAAMARVEARVERQESSVTLSARAETSITIRLLAVEPEVPGRDRHDDSDAHTPWEASAARAAYQ